MSQDFLDSISSRPVTSWPSQRSANANRSTSNGYAFQDVLNQVQQSKTELKISAHAQARLAQRGLTMSQEEWNRVGQAVQRAAQKGAKDAYVMYGNTGLVVNVPNRTVVTAMFHQDEMIVTNIDSVVSIPQLDR